MPAERRTRQVTRADVARYAGVSTAVVSYVLNNGPKPVAPLTRERVLDAVRVLGYRPNAAARALSKGTADMFGIVVHDNRNPFFAEMCHALDQASTQAGRSLLIVNSDRRQVHTADQIEELVARQISGLIIADVLTAAEQALVESLPIPSVVVTQFSGTSAMPSVGVDFRAGARETVEHLVGHGYRDIAFIGSAARFDERELGWADALDAAGLPHGRLIHAPFSYQGGYEAGQALATAATRPRAVFAASDQIAIGLLSALHESGVRVPADIAVASFDGTMVADYVWPRLTTAEQPLERMAEAAVARLLDAGSPDRFEAFPTRLRIRESCGCGAD